MSMRRTLLMLDFSGRLIRRSSISPTFIRTKGLLSIKRFWSGPLVSSISSKQQPSALGVASGVPTLPSVLSLRLGLRLRNISNAIYGADISLNGFNNYEDGRHTFKLEVPEYFNFAGDVLDKWAEREQIGERRVQVPAFWWIDDAGNEVKWTYTDLVQRCKRAANVLEHECSLESFDRVIVILPRIPEWWLLNIACIRTGVVMSPGSTLLTAKDILSRLQASQAKCIITDKKTADVVDQIAPHAPSLKSKLIVDSSGKDRLGWIQFNKLLWKASPNHECVKTKSDDAMTIFFTSGTTGMPKMTLHTHASYGLGHTITGRHWLDLTPEDVLWNLSDTGWAKSAYSSLFAPWMLGSCVFSQHSAKFDSIECLRILGKYPITVICFPPTAYRMVVLEHLGKHKFPALKHCVSAGEPLNPEVVQQWKEGTGLSIREGYGQTEMTLAVGTFRCMEVKPGSMGKPAPGYDVKIIDDEGREVGTNIEGGIGVRIAPERPVGLFERYLDDPERTAATFVGDFYLTGDRAYRDEDGYLWFVGRSDDVIISAGYRIGPFEVESALLEHPAVAESAVVSTPDELRGEVVKAYVVLVPDYIGNKHELVKELQDHVKMTTAPYKYPRKIEFVDDLPKTISGKIRRVELRNKEWT